MKPPPGSGDALRRVPKALVRGCGVGLAAIALGLLLSACLGPAPERWGDGIPDSQRSETLRGLPAEARSRLLPLSEIFYERIASRRFNSRATFEDPSIRQFFPDVATYSDYYASLVDDLDRAAIEYNRPTRIDLLGLEAGEGGRVRLELRFVGENDLPLRWWWASLTRVDEWQWRDGRWWVIPGKV